MGKANSAADDFGGLSGRLKKMAFGRATVLVIALIGMLALIIALVWPANDTPDQCGSARPTVAVRLGDGVSMDSPLAQELPLFLAYYPILTLSERVAEVCASVPQFALEVSATPAPHRSINAVLRDLGSGKAVWSERYDLRPTPGYDPQLIIAARIAYRLGKPMGELERIAASMPWQNGAARMEFMCLHGANSLYFGGSEEQIAESHECLVERATTSTSADVPATFVAVDLMKSYAASGGQSGSLSPIGEHAIARARQIDPSSALLLEMELAIHRIRKPLDLARIGEILRMIEEQYPYHPNMLRNLSGHYGDMLGDYPRAVESARLAALIAPDEPTFAWGKILANFGTRRWPELVEDRAEIMRLNRIESALLALAMAPYGPSPHEDAKAARQWIDEQNLSNRDALQKRIAGLAYSDKIKIALNEVAAEHYPPLDDTEESVAAGMSIEAMDIP